MRCFAGFLVVLLVCGTWCSFTDAQQTPRGKQQAVQASQALTSPVKMQPVAFATNVILNQNVHNGAAPLGCTLDETSGNERLYVVDLFSGNTFRYDLALNPIDQIASPAGINTTTGIAFNRTTGTSLYWIDATTGTLFETDLDGLILDSNPIASSGGGLIGGLCFQDDGTLWADDIVSDQYDQFDTVGAYLGNTFPNPLGAGTFGNGISHSNDAGGFHVAVGNTGQVDRCLNLDAAGTVLNTLWDMNDPNPDVNIVNFDTFVNGHVVNPTSLSTGFSSEFFVGNATNQIFEIDNFGCQLIAISDVQCLPTGGGEPLDVTVTWTENDTYTEVNVSRNGAVVATLAPGIGEYNDLGLTTGNYTYSVNATDGTDCANGGSCSVSVTPNGDCVETSMPGAPISSTLPPVLDTITAACGQTVGDLTVAIDITHTFQGDLQIDLTGPSSAISTLHSQQGGADDNIFAYYNTNGAPNGSVPYNTGEFIQPPDPFALLGNIGGSTDGDWTLSVADLVGGDDGTLNSWSIITDIANPGFPVGNLACNSVSGTGTVDASWTNTSVYDEINVYVNGGLEATLAGTATGYTTNVLPIPSLGVMVCVEGVISGTPTAQNCCTADVILDQPQNLACVVNGVTIDASWTNPGAYDNINVFVDGLLEATIAGTETSYTTDPYAGPTPAGVTVCLEGILAGGTSAQTCCTSLIAGVVDLEVCSTTTPSPQFGDNGVADVSDTINVATSFIIGEAQMSVTLTHAFVGDVTMDVSSPAATVVRLHEGGGGADDNIVVLYTDIGIPNGPPYNCVCAMQPSGFGGVGSLADFETELSDGDWIISLNDAFAGSGGGTLDAWCVRFNEGCAVPPPSGLSCSESGGDVSLEWTNEDTYDSIDVEKDGLIVATLGGGETSYTDNDAGTGSHTYRVFGNDDTTLLCGNPSVPCTALVNITDLIWAPPAQATGVTDDAAGIEAALANNGVGALITDTLPADLSAFTRVWAVLGTFGINHALTPDEGTTLRDYCLNNNGSLYVTGSDTWGFDAPTPLDEVDGIAAAVDGSGACDNFMVTGLDSMQGLDLTAFAGATTDNGGECAWIDQFQAYDDGAAVWLSDGGYENGSFNDGNQVTVGMMGDYRVLCQSWEFSTYGDAAQRDTLMEAYLTALGGGGTPVDEISRGDCDGSGTFNGLVDGLAALNFQFVPGSPVPPCLDQCDFDDNNVFNGLVDGLGILNFQFVPGSNPPAPPGTTCGEDPTGLFDCATVICP